MKEEIWKDIKNYEGLYQVSNLGKVKGVIKNIVLSPANNSGYMRVNLYKDGKRNMKSVHRLVAEAFIPNPENKKTVDHINHIRDDNRVENLQWATPTEQNDEIRNKRAGESLRKTHGDKVENVVINGVEYNSRREAARQLGFNRTSLSYAINVNKSSFMSNGVEYKIG